ncbi:putative Pentatricopeptide repeat-containing protein [Zostera marina]|uniref:Putative Pentatricopeptide repeat-containing protein n=1 Tax=Zostera marina TaxID=29655 RepID=A0A0K9P7Y4_ZOSMR|nr:putative Pentatricopeptide repeat-containing protein [Zostera marina]
MGVSLLFRSSCRRVFPRFLSTTALITESSETPLNISPLVKSLVKEQNKDVLVTRFNEISSISAHFRCKGDIYLTIINRLIAAGRKDAIFKILEAQKLTPGITNEWFAQRIISLYGKAKMADEAESTFYQLPSLNCPRSVLSLNALLHAFNEAREYQRTVDALNSIPLTKECEEIVPDVYSYTVAIHAMCSMGDIEAAVEQLGIMETKEVEPNVVTYCTIMSGYYRHGRTEDAEKIWERMMVKNCSPDVKCYNAKLRALCFVNRISEAEELIKVMRNNGLKPDTFSYTCLITGHCKAGTLEDANKVFEEMQKRECQPNRATFGALIPKLCEAGRFGQARRFCNDCIHRKVVLKKEILQAVADGLAETDKVGARQLVQFAWASRMHSKETLKMPPSCDDDV